MAGGFLDEPLYRVLTLGLKEWSSDPHVAAVALQDGSRGLRANLLGTKCLGSSAAPNGHFRMGTYIVNPGHDSIRRDEPPIRVALNQDHRRRSLLACSAARGGEEERGPASDAETVRARTVRKQECPRGSVTDQGGRRERVIGIDPHKASHTAVAIDEARRRALERQSASHPPPGGPAAQGAEPFEKRTWAIESASGLGHLLAQRLVARGEEVLDVPNAVYRQLLLDAR